MCPRATTSCDVSGLGRLVLLSDPSVGIHFQRFRGHRRGNRPPGSPNARRLLAVERVRRVAAPTLGFLIPSNLSQGGACCDGPLALRELISGIDREIEDGRDRHEPNDAKVQNCGG